MDVTAPMTPKERAPPVEVCDAAIKLDAEEMTREDPCTSFEKRTMGPVPPMPCPTKFSVAPSPQVPTFVLL